MFFSEKSESQNFELESKCKKMSVEMENLNSETMILRQDLNKQKDYCFEMEKQLQQLELDVEESEFLKFLEFKQILETLEIQSKTKLLDNSKNKFEEFLENDILQKNKIKDQQNEVKLLNEQLEMIKNELNMEKMQSQGF